MERQYRTIAAAVLAACLMAGGGLSGCAGPSTRILPRNVSNEQPYEVPEENQVLEEVNPFYLQESLDYLSAFVRQSGTPGEEEAAEYIGRLLTDYGYETRIQEFSGEDLAGDLAGDPAGIPAGDGTIRGRNVIGIRKAAAPDGDILVIAASHDSMQASPGANNNASGVVSLLECARLLSRLSTDTELRFVSFSGSMEGSAGAIAYLDSLTETELHRIIGVIQLDTLGYAPDARIVLGTMDGERTLLGDLLGTAAGEVPGLTSGWYYTRREEGNHVPFVRKEIPAVVVSQSKEAYENGSPQDRAELVNVELLAGVVDTVSHTVAWLMSEDTPSQLAKSRFVNRLQGEAWVQRKDVRFPFGEGPVRADARIGITGVLASSIVDGAGVQVDTYQYRMKWFDVDQIILTNYHYSDGKLETISLDADGAGVEYEEMKDRICSWYGEPVEESSGPNGTEYDWTDPIYHKSISLVPASDGFETEIRDYTPERRMIGAYLPDGSVVRQDSADSRLPKLFGLVRDIIPEEYYGMISQLIVYTDGVGDTACYLEAPVEDAEGAGEDTEDVGAAGQAEIWIDIEDAFTENGDFRNRTETVRLLTRAFGQLVEQDGQDRYGAAYRTQFVPDDAEAAPEFAEDFMRFILFQKPVEIRDRSDGRIQFFYNFEELVKIRTWIRGNMKLGDEMPAEILPPEGGTVLPAP